MKPTPGKQYITIQGDTLQTIAAQAFGDPTQVSLIQNINPSNFDIDDQLPTSTSLIIPIDAELESLRQVQLQNGLKGVK